MDFKNKYLDVMKDFVRQQLVLNVTEVIVKLIYFQKIIPEAEMNGVVTAEWAEKNWKSLFGKSCTIKNSENVLVYILFHGQR